jgi:hypothetical protein
MSVTNIKQSIPGINEAQMVQSKINQAGIEDVKLFYDREVIPYGMWSLVQVKKNTSQILMPDSYKDGNLQPTIMWLCKDEHGRFRVPNNQDVRDCIVSIKRAQEVFKKGGDWLDDQFIEQDVKKQETYKKEQREKIHKVAPSLQKAIKKENW